MGHPLYSKIKVCKKWFTNDIYKMWKIGGQKLPILQKYLVRLKYHTRIWRRQLKNMILKALTLQRLVANIIIKWFEIKFKAFGMIVTAQSSKNMMTSIVSEKKMEHVAKPPIYLHWDFMNFWHSPVWNIQLYFFLVWTGKKSQFEIPS